MTAATPAGASPSPSPTSSPGPSSSPGPTPGPPPRAAAWVYSGLWRVLVGWFHVPDRPPVLPVRPDEAVHAFGPARGFLSYLKLWLWIGIGFLLLVTVVLAIALAAAGEWLALAIATIPLLAIAIVITVLVLIAIHLQFDTTWYVMTERSLRIRRGIWIIHEITITFENVQNVKVTQGPVQRVFGISNLVVETAGGGGAAAGHGGGGHQARIEGVVDAEALRDRILARLRQARTAGLGDEHAADEAGAAPAWTPEHLGVLREIREIALALR